MSESILRPPATRDVSSLADWIEATMAIEDRSMLAKAVVRKRLAADGNDDEAAVSLVMTEIRRRRRLAGTLYPYSAGGAGVQRQAVPNRAYDFLLACSLDDAPFRHGKDWHNAVRLFEHLSAVALSTVFGPGTQSLRFGSPPDAGRPDRFGEALVWLGQKIGLTAGQGKTSGAEQDGGVDTVSWRPFRDGRVGFPVLLGQCTLQGGYEAKGSDIIVPRWKAWIAFHRDPLTALIVPFSLGQAHEDWEEIHFTVDVIVDRFRLCELLEAVDLSSWPEANLMEGWLDHELNGLRLAV